MYIIVYDLFRYSFWMRFLLPVFVYHLSSVFPCASVYHAHDYTPHNICFLYDCRYVYMRTRSSPIEFPCGLCPPCSCSHLSYAQTVYVPIPLSVWVACLLIMFHARFWFGSCVVIALQIELYCINIPVSHRSDCLSVFPILAYHPYLAWYRICKASFGFRLPPIRI